MNQPDESDDKPFEATQKKLEDARKKGEIPRSQDLTTAAAYGGFLLLGASFGGALLFRLGEYLSGLLSRAPEIAADLFSGGLRAQTGAMALPTVIVVSPWFAVPAVLAAVAIAAQRSFVFTPSRLKPKLGRISIIANARNKFGRQGLFEFVKSLVKLLILSVTLGLFLIGRTDEIMVMPGLDAPGVVLGIGALALDFLRLVFIVALIIGAIDVLWQRAEHFRKNRMSRKEMMDELKQTEGDPHIKQQRRQKGQQIALNRMLADVPGADVVVVNPTHYAVALKWSRAPGTAPVCVAKGVDEIAARIRELAEENGVPIHRDPPTARSLHALVRVGEEVLPEHYSAVAAAIRFADEMSRRAARWRPGDG